MFQWLKESYKPFFLCVFIFIALLVKLFINNLRKRSSNLPPGPPTIPFIGNLHQLGTMPHISLQSLADKYGPIIFLQLGEIPTVVVSSARLAKEVLKTHDLALASRPQLFSAMYLFYNCTDIAFAPYSAYWRHVRKICILELLSAKRVNSYSAVREEEVASLVQRVAGSYPETINLSKILGLYANNGVCRVAFGRDFTEGGESKKYGFQKMLDEYQELLGGFSVGDFFPSLEFIHSLTGMKTRLQDTSRKFDQLIDQIVSEHKACNKIKEHKDLVDILLEVQENDLGEMPLTIDNIKAIILVSDEALITMYWFISQYLKVDKA